MRPGGGKPFGGDTFDLCSPASGQREPRQQCNGIATEPGRLQVPYYLNAHYWWAYIHPRAVQL
ncbi:MAG: hypothetical protein WAN75_47015, partial [Xanthobacteraceae bacterium]